MCVRRLKMKVYVDDVKIHVWGKNRDTRGYDESVWAVERGGRKRRIDALREERGKDCKSKMIGSCSNLEKRLEEDCKKVGVGLADSVEMLGHGFSTRTRRLGVENKKQEAKKLKQMINITKQTVYEGRNQQVVEEDGDSCEDVEF